MDSSSSNLVTEMISHLKPPLPLIDHDESSKIGKFYAGRSVFITGATGFIGKALVEKLVRSCSKIKTIFLLIRDKRGKDINERLKDLISSQCFDRIRELNDGSNRLLEQKLHPIRGDITMAKFGISPEDMRLLSSECSIVFNSAATIRFVEPIDHAVLNNIYSVGQLVEFCDQLDKLEALVHLSTAYSNCHKRDTIYEIFYEPPMSGCEIQTTVQRLRTIQENIHVYPLAADLYANDAPDSESMSSASRDTCEQQKFYFDQYDSNDFLADTSIDFHSVSKANDISDGSTANGTRKQQTRQDANAKRRAQAKASDENPYDLLQQFTRIALRRSNRPNTYTFTKAISESYLLDRVKARKDRYLGDKIPVAIVRPSIVGGAWREPIVGLVDNYNGPTGAILSLYTGALQAMPGRGERVADLVPVDMVANMLLATGWYLVEKAKMVAPTVATGDRKPSTGCEHEIKRDQGAYLFNFVSGYQNPVRWHQVTDKIAELAYRYPSKFLARLPASYFIHAGKLYELYDRLNQRLPAQLTDFVRRNLFGQQVEGRSSALAGYRRIKQMTDTLTPFTSNQWRLCDSNTRSLLEQLDATDKNIFHFDVKSIDWELYLRNYIIGSRIYTLKDEAENVPRAMRSLKRREMLNSGLMAAFMFIVFFFVLQHVFRLLAQLDL